MKKVLIIPLILILCGSLFASTTYNITTKYGKEQVVIPDNYTVEDVLLSISKAYYELNYEHEELIDSYEQLSNEVSSYIEKNISLRNDYDELLIDYQELTKLLKSYGRLSNFKGFVGGNINYYDSKVQGCGLTIGMFLFNKTLLFGSVNYPFSFNIGVGFVI